MSYATSSELNPPWANVGVGATRAAFTPVRLDIAALVRRAPGDWTSFIGDSDASRAHDRPEWLRPGAPLAERTQGDGSTAFGPYVPATAQVQVVTASGSPTGGTFTLTLNGNTTAPLAVGASAESMQAALAALPSVGPTGVAVVDDGAPGTPRWRVAFAGSVPQMTASASFTGGQGLGIAVRSEMVGSPSGSAALAGFLVEGVRIPPLNVPVPGLMYGSGIIYAKYLPVGVDAPGRLSAAGRLSFV